MVTVDESFHATFGAGTIFRDDTPSLETDSIPRQWAAGGVDTAPVLVIQCAASHVARLQEYVRAAHGIGALAVIAPLSGFKCGRDDRCLAYRPMAGASSLVVAMLSDVLITRYVQRWYLLDGRAGTLEQAVDGVLARLAPPPKGASPALDHAPAAKPAVRIQAFPRILEAAAVDRVRRSGRAEPDTRGETLACVAFFLSAYYYGVSTLDPLPRSGGSSLPWPAHGSAHGPAAATRSARPPSMDAALGAAVADSSLGAAGALDGALHASLQASSHVCRAYYKLREAQGRIGLELRVPRAIDVGASPGGWTVCLCSLGCERVTSVDPGALSLPPALAASGRIEHLQMKIEEALPLLAARSEQVLFQLLVCDMNAPPSDVVAMAQHALPLLADRAPLVLTFKNPYVRKAEWHEALEAGVAALEGFADDVTVLHLLANTTKETTVCARVRPKEQRDAAVAAAAASAARLRAAANAEAWARVTLICGGDRGAR